KHCDVLHSKSGNVSGSMIIEIDESSHLHSCSNAWESSGEGQKVSGYLTRATRRDESDIWELIRKDRRVDAGVLFDVLAANRADRVTFANHHPLRSDEAG